MTSDFAPELVKYSKRSPKPQIVQNSVRAYELKRCSFFAACFVARLCCRQVAVAIIVTNARIIFSTVLKNRTANSSEIAQDTYKSQTVLTACRDGTCEVCFNDRYAYFHIRYDMIQNEIKLFMAR